MNSELKISVVIPTYNRQDTLRRAVDSVLAQTCPAEEVIVVDDGSTDGTRQLMDSIEYQAVKCIYQDNQGVSCARNTGIRQSNGDWIAFLDSDDEWLPDKLEMQVNALSEQPDYQFCHSNEIWIRNGRRVNPMRKHEKNGGYIFEKCLPMCVISPSSVLMKKAVFEEMGLFDESLPACEDYDLWLRYCVKHPVLFVDKPLLKKYGGHADQLSTKYLGMDQYRLKALLNLLKSDDLTMEQVNLAKSTFNKKYNILHRGAKKHGNRRLLNLCEDLLQEMHSQLTRWECVG